MVSTRGIKYKFSEGEKVLCYEPDPAKTKVLYNSKVLQIIVSKDEHGKKLVEFLIHFQGWNSTWDRFVTEEYVLKDTEENRQLQKELAEKAQLTSGGNLYKKDRKKRRRKLSERISESLEPKRGEASPVTEPEADIDASSLSDPSSELESDSEIKIELSDIIKAFLDEDARLVNEENKLSKLPSTPNIVTILGNFVKNWAMKQLIPGNEKPNRSQITQPAVIDVDTIQRKLNLCKEVADGLRIYFDFSVWDMLLYGKEREQYKAIISTAASTHFNSNSEDPRVEGTNGETQEDKYHPDNESERNRRKSLRSHKVSSGYEHTNGTSNKPSTIMQNSGQHLPFDGSNNAGSSDSSTNSPRHRALINHIQSWKFVPLSLYDKNPAPPSLVYGAVHLARLFVKLPELLSRTNMPEEKLEVVLEYFDYFLKYLEEHPEWFGDQHYIDNPTPPPQLSD